MTKRNSKPAVILVHGLWMRPWTWRSFQKFLQDQGYTVYTFAWSTTRAPLDRSAMQLTAFINSRPEDTVHLVVHSMGGILAMHTLPLVRKQGKLLMLGSPINGSGIAKRLKKMKWDRAVLNEASSPLRAGVTEVEKTNRETMMIAGTSPYGLGRLINPKLGVSDGTVGLEETQADWLDHHQTVHCNHMGLLVNEEAKQLALEFLKS